MKKSILLFAMMLLLGGIVNAQSTENNPAGMHGGVIFGKQDLKFELVVKGSDVLIYPTSADGKILRAVPTKAEINVVPLAIRNGQNFKEVTFADGCFKVSRDNDMPLYIVSISTFLNDKQYDAKYVYPNVNVK